MDISIHAPAKGATIAQINFFIPIYISIHAPAKGATRLRHTLRGSKRISIHAPAKGATLKTSEAQIARAFQSTLPRRERPVNDRGGAIQIEFQSTLPRRERLNCRGFSDRNRNISIHAPAKGATSEYYTQIPCNQISIHAPAKGATLICENWYCNKLFQSTLPRRERPFLLVSLIGR